MFCILFFLAIATINDCSSMDMSLVQKQQKSKEAAFNGQHIIFLNGTTTAGKSSIALQLKERLEKQSLSVEVLAIDTFIVPKIQWALVTNRLNPFNVFVPNSDIITHAEIEKMGKDSQAELCMAAKSAYDQGKIVIIDAPAYRSDQIVFYKQVLSGFNVTWSLVYCPVSTLIERVIGRNEKSGTTEQRSILQALDQFQQLYKKTTGSETSDSIDKLLAKDLYDLCNRAKTEHDIIQNRIPDFLKSIQKAICPSDFDTIEQLLFKELTSDDNAKTHIVPVFKHDCILNTGLYDSAVCAETIFNVLQKK